MTIVRYFVGINFPAVAVMELLRIQQLLSDSQLCTGTWVKPDNLHVTLLFLGNLTKDELESTEHALSVVSPSPFFTQLERLEVPHWSKPQLVWVTLKNDGLEQLYEKLVTALPSYQEARPFKAHCTLARLKKAANKKALKNLVETIQVTPLSWEVTTFSLYASRTEPTGAEYTILKTYPS